MNNSIALGARGPDIRPARNRAAAMDGRNAMMQGQLQQMQMQSAMQASQRDAQMRNALAGVDPNADDYYRQAASAVQGIDPMAAAGFVDKSAARKKTQLDTQASELEVVTKKVKLAGQVLGSATDAQDFQMKVAQGVQAGFLDERQAQALLSQPWTPEQSEYWTMQGMEADKRLQVLMERERFDEEKRHNRATESNQPLVEIYDENSPTGTRMVSRGAAVNQPGKPPSNMSVTSPDGTTIQFGRSGGALPKGAETQFAKDIVGNQQALDGINQTLSLYEPEFLTYGGAAKGAAATVMNKLDPEKRSQFQARRSAFISSANRQFLTFRKWATGVAGGEKEMAEIKRATFSEDDSPQDFEAKIALARSLYRRLNARSKAALAAGVNNEHEFQKFIQANPLDSIPTIQERGDQLHSQGYSEEQVLELLSQEGYL